MKRWLAVLAAALLLLCACSNENEEQESYPETIRFYYCTPDYLEENGAAQAETYGTENGSMGWEPHRMGKNAEDVGQVLTAYLEGPVTEQLYSLLPSDADALQWSLEDKILTLRFGAAAEKLSGIQKTQAAACLVHTMTQLPQIGSVYAPELSDAILRPDDFLLLDDTAFSNEMVLHLYYSDETGRYLRSETVSHQFQENESMSTYAIRLLLSEPREEGSQMALPHGTRLFWSRVEDGVCVINFSKEFLDNAPMSHAEARTAIFSVVNTLTELPEIESVQFLCAGMQIEDYVGLDLTMPLYREEPVILSEKEEHWYYDATLYVPCGKGELLLPVPVMVANSDPEGLPLRVLNALIEFNPINGYENPIPGGTAVLDLTVENGLCMVLLNQNFAMCDASPRAARGAVSSIVSTLCSLESVNRVRLEVQDAALSAVDLSKPMSLSGSLLHP